MASGAIDSILHQTPSYIPYLAEQVHAAYSEEEHRVWAELVARRIPQLARHAAEEYLEGFAVIGLRADRLPDLSEISLRLQPRTGWNTIPVSGFMPAPAFFEMLATRQFPTTTWLRKRDSLDYTPEPDIFHDVFGHVPMHAHRIFADFLQRYGQLCASIAKEKNDDHSILERIGRLFWYTVEFGLIRQHGRVKVYGSGLISSSAECTNVIEGRCEIREFSLDAVLDTPVKVDEMNKVLFAIKSFDQIYAALQQLEQKLADGEAI